MENFLISLSKSEGSKTCSNTKISKIKSNLKSKLFDVNQPCLKTILYFFINFPDSSGSAILLLTFLFYFFYLINIFF